MRSLVSYPPPPTPWTQGGEVYGTLYLPPNIARALSKSEQMGC